MKKLFSAVLLLLLAMLVVSCHGGITGTSGQVGRARVRLAQLAPDLPIADVWLDDQVLQDSVPYTSFSSAFTLDAGGHRITWNQSGTVPPQSLVDVSVSLNADSFYSFALVGRGTHTLLPLTDRQTLDLNNATVRIVNARPDTGRFLVQLAREVVLLKSDTLRFTQNSTYGTITPGFMFTQVFDTDMQTLLLDTTLTVSADTTYTIYLLAGEGDPNPPKFTAKLKVDAP